MELTQKLTSINLIVSRVHYVLLIVLIGLGFFIIVGHDSVIIIIIAIMIEIIIILFSIASRIDDCVCISLP